MENVFLPDGRTRMDHLPGKGLRQVRRKSSDGQLDRRLGSVVFIGRHHALVDALVLSPDRRDPQMDLAVLLSNRLQQVPVFDPNDGRPWISA